MPSPIAHITVGYFAGKRAKFNIWLCVLLSILPDFDFLPGILFKDPAGWHGTFSHSFLALFACVFFVSCFLRLAGNFAGVWRIPSIAMFIYASHILMDFFTDGRGIMLLWPLQKRYISPFPLFVGLRWRDPLISVSHVWTICNEGLFAVSLILFAYGIKNIRLIVTGKTVNSAIKTCYYNAVNHERNYENNSERQR